MGDRIAEALADWERVTEEIAPAFVAFDQSRLDARSACGEWTNRQLMAHIATGYAVRAGWLREGARG